MKAKRKRLPVGVDDYNELYNECYFIDKTKLIGKIIDSHCKVTLITRPRRFGKTLNMNMLYYFFTSDNAAENSKLFADTDIERMGEEYMAEQGAYPTVFVTLKGVYAIDYEGALGLLALLMQDLYGKFNYLMKSEALTEKEKEYFDRIWSKSTDKDDLQLALKRLTDFLCRHHKKKVILLIDEYDVMIQAAWEHGYYEKAIAFVRVFLGEALKSNASLHFAVLTGVLRVAKESIFSSLNNFKVDSVISAEYATSFGFTQEEVNKMARDLGYEDKLPEIKSWYDGYHFSGYDMYNPWSVINYFAANADAAPYWVNTSANGILKTMLESLDEERAAELKGLMEGKTVETEIKEGVIYADINKNRDALYTMLVTTGYLQCIERKRVYDKEYVSLTIPNREIRAIFDSEICDNLAVGLGGSTVYFMMKAMLDGDTELFALRLQSILKETVSVHDTAQPETFYHGLMLGLTVLLSDTYTVESNRESGYGRFDLALIPKDSANVGVIMEFKRAESEGELERKAAEALEQIAAKEYITRLTASGVKTIWRYGIAFFGKRMFMERE